MKRKINIRPDTDVYATYKRLSYQHWSALAEFVDNSTQSFYDHQDTLMSTKYYKNLKIEIDYIDGENGDDYIVIKDNAFGMEWSDFVRAINLHKPPKNTSGRNEFGMGLKTAACWYGNLWSVESTQLGSSKKYRATVDVDMLERYKNEEIEVEEETVSPKEHYTIITIRKLNQRITGSRTKGKIKDLLSSTYREDIRGGLIDIIFKGEHLQFKEAPIYTENTNGQLIEWKKDIDFTINHNGLILPVSGFVAIRIPGSVKDAGFTLIRRGRVIIGGSEKTYRPYEVFGDSNLYPYQRMFGELHMDNWPVTQAKDAFDWNNSGLEELFIEKLIEHTKDYKQKASSIRVREKVTTQDVISQVIDGMRAPGVFDKIDFKIVDDSDVPKVTEEMFVDETDEENNEQSNPLEQNNIDDENPASENSGVDIQGGTSVIFNFEYKKVPYSFSIMLDRSTPYAYWLSVEMKQNNVYEVKINTRHAFFIPYIEKRDFIPLITKLSIAMVLAESESKKISPDGRINADDIRLYMNKILEDIARRNIANE